jgi:non-ribosomal peptide synthetase component E (peptide arylation enzyme)
MRFQTILNPKHAACYVEEGHWTNETFFGVLEQRAGAHPHREVFCDAHRRITYGELKQRIEQCAEFLRRIGLRRGDVVTIQLPNRIEFPIVFFALELIGAIANKVNPDFRTRELEYILRFSESRAFVCPKEFKSFDYATMAKHLKASVLGLEHIIVVGGAVDGTWDFEEVAKQQPIASSDRVGMDPNEIFRMAFTSGTTGDPKCVLHSFNTTLGTVRLLNSDMQVTDRDVLLVYLPVGLNWGYICLLQTIMAGARAVLIERFSAHTALEAIQNERVTYIPTAPASIVSMLNEPSLASFDLSSLRVVITGGASAAIETIREYQQRMSGHLIELYGMLETGFHTYTRFTDDPQQVNGTIGRVAASMGLRILDEEGNDVPYGEVGEIAALGPSVHLGYHNNPQANADSFTADGWFRTGDLAKFVDAAGNVQIVGRRKEIINRGGKKFFPREVEEVLYTHPKIMHAAMVGIADARLGERNCLCVIPKSGQQLQLQEVVDFLKGQVADYKLPEMLFQVDKLPLTGTGKVRRHILREQMEKRLRPS